MDDIVAGIAEVLAWSLEVEVKATAAREDAAPEDIHADRELHAALVGWLAINGIDASQDTEA